MMSWWTGTGQCFLGDGCWRFGVELGLLPLFGMKVTKLSFSGYADLYLFGVYCLLGDFKFYYSTRWLQYVITSNIVHSWDGSVCKAKFIFCWDFLFWRSWYGESVSHSRLIICALRTVCKSLSNIQKASLNSMCSPSNPWANCQLICTFLTINVIPIRSVFVFPVAIQQF